MLECRLCQKNDGTWIQEKIGHNVSCQKYKRYIYVKKSESDLKKIFVANY